MTDLPRRLPTTFGSTRESLHALACYAVAPARKARTGRIGLRSLGDAIGTPPFDDGSRITIRGDRLAIEPGASVTISTVGAAAAFLRITPSPDPGVGTDLPLYEPDADLAVDAYASAVLASWYAFGDRLLRALSADPRTVNVTEAQLWPEHFDLAVTVDLGPAGGVNVGFSPGDASSTEPYVYVGPYDRSRLDGAYWNAPFGALLRYEALMGAPASDERARSFITEGLELVRERPTA